MSLAVIGVVAPARPRRRESFVTLQRISASGTSRRRHLDPVQQQPILQALPSKCHEHRIHPDSRSMPSQFLSLQDIDRVIEMAWEDRTPFEAIEFQFGLSESAVIALMRTELKSASFRAWRRRVSGRKSKHGRTNQSDRFKAACQR